MQAKHLLKGASWRTQGMARRARWARRVVRPKEFGAMLTAKQRELLEQFRATETGEESPQSAGFFTKLKDMWDDLTD